MSAALKSPSGALFPTYEVFSRNMDAKVKYFPEEYSAYRKRELTLTPEQQVFFDRIMKGDIKIDNSKMGRGKTVLTIAVAKARGLPLFIICPLIVAESWVRHCYIYDVPYIFISTYGSLRGKTGSQPKHGYLIREDYIDEYNGKDVKITEYTPTPAFRRLVATGFALVIDEFQYLKNKSAQFLACLAFARAVNESKNCTISLLSGTIIDKVDQIANTLKLTGIMKSDRLYQQVDSGFGVVGTGINEVIAYASKIDPVKTHVMTRKNIMSKAAQIKNLAFDLYVEVIKDHIAGQTEDSPDGTINGYRLDIYNGFYNVSEPFDKFYHKSIDKLDTIALARAMEKDAKNKDKKKAVVGRVSKLLRKIEVTKAFDMARVGKGLKENDTRRKIIIAVNYIDTLIRIQELLENVGYNVVILVGATKPDERASIINKFNNNDDIDFLLMTVPVGGVGISLHDTQGGRPRCMLISPSYKLMQIIQCSYRIFRQGQRSDAAVYLFYIGGERHNHTKELRILESLREKGHVLTEALAGDSKAETPNNYEEFIEDDDVEPHYLDEYDWSGEEDEDQSEAEEGSEVEDEGEGSEAGERSQEEYELEQDQYRQEVEMGEVPEEEIVKYRD